MKQNNEEQEETILLCGSVVSQGTLLNSYDLQGGSFLEAPLVFFLQGILLEVKRPHISLYTLFLQV